MMASPPSGSPLPSPDVISRPPSLQPPPVEDHTGPPPFSQVAPFASPSPSPSPSPPAPSPVVDKTSPPSVPQFASPPSPSLSPFTPVVVFAPVNLVPPILTPSLTSPPPPPPIITPIVSPSHLVEAPPPPKVASTSIISVSSPLPPEPTRPSIASPLFPTVPLSPPTPPPGLPPPSQPRTSLPHLATPTTLSRPPPPRPLITPLTHSSPPTEVLPAPTELNYTPPPAFPLQPPLPPTSVISPPLSLPLPNVNLPVNSRQSHLSTGLIIVLIIGGIFLLLALGLVCISYKNKRRRNHTKAEHFHVPPSLKPEGQIKHGLTQGEHVVEVRTGTFSLPLPSTTGRGSRSVISRSENPLPLQSPYVVSALSRGTFTYDELVGATDGFSEAKLIGEGGFGYVHKGFLRNGQEVAIKQLREGGRQGEREFQAEVEIISRVLHKHLVSLIGYCISGTKRLLVYEFVPNSTLEFRLHGNEQPVMDWPTRLKIAVGSAKGLAYLHEDCNPVIIHRDIKASNILLDHKFEAKVSDFGFAKSLSNARNSITHSSTRVVGTFGYLAPEYATSGKVTEKSDVYSYGVMLLELITGRPPISDINSLIREALVIWARPLLNQALEDGNFEAIVDPRLKNNYDTDEMTSMIACAAACVRHSSWLRPRMSQIAHALEGDISIVDLNEGMNPGQSNIYGCTSSLNTALANSQCGISTRSGNTSEYGLNLCSSSSNSSNR